MIDLKNCSILMISQDPGLLAGSGAGDVVERHQRYAGFVRQLDIIVLSKQGQKQSRLADNCRVFGFSSDLAGLLQAIKFGQQLCREIKYDLIDTQDPHATGWLGYRLSKKFKIRLEVHLHGDFLQNKHWLREAPKNRIYNIIQKAVLPKADAIRVVNKNFGEELFRLGIDRDKVEVINTPVNEKAFVNEVDHEAKLDEKFAGKKLLLFIGRLVPAKNLIFTLDVIKKLSQKRKDFGLLIIGDGELKGELLTKIDSDRLQDIVSIKSSMTHAQLLPYYKSAYLFILLSTNESFGKVIIEAGFTGLPTLASTSAGPQTVISDGVDGWLVPINDLDMTVEKISLLLDQPDQVKGIGLVARTEFLTRYGQEASFEKIKNFWTKIINK